MNWLKSIFGPPKCMSIHEVAAMEIELHGNIVSKEAAEHVDSCPVTGFLKLRDEKIEDATMEFAKILAAAQPAGERTSTWDICSNAPADGRRHWWKTEGERTFCVNCGWRKGRFL